MTVVCLEALVRGFAGAVAQSVSRGNSMDVPTGRSRSEPENDTWAPVGRPSKECLRVCTVALFSRAFGNLEGLRNVRTHMKMTHALSPLLARSVYTIAIVAGATLFGLILVACGSDPIGEPPSVNVAADSARDPLLDVDRTTSYPGDVVVLEWNIFGGCDLLDTCGHYRIFGDGSVEASRGRAAAAAGAVDVTGQVAPSLVVALMDNADTDGTAVIAALATPGACASQYDAMDTRLWISPAYLELDSCEFALFESAHPLVRAAIELGNAATEAAPVD